MTGGERSQRLNEFFYWDSAKGRYFPKSSLKNQQMNKDPTREVDFIPLERKQTPFPAKTTPLFEVEVPSTNRFAKGAYVDDCNNEVVVQLYDINSEYFVQFNTEPNSIPTSTMSQHFQVEISRGTGFSIERLDNTIGRSYSTYIDNRPESNGAFLITDGYLIFQSLNPLTNSYEQELFLALGSNGIADKVKNEFCIAEKRDIFTLTVSDMNLSQQTLTCTKSDILAIKITNDNNAVYFSTRQGEVGLVDRRIRGKDSATILFTHPNVAINNLKIFENSFMLLYSTTNDFVYCRDIRFPTSNALFMLPHFSHADWSLNVSHLTQLALSPIEPTCFYATRNNGRVFAKYNLLNGEEAIERLDKQVLFTQCTDSALWIFTSFTTE